MRSRSAAAILAGAGFEKAAGMAGGIRAWHGLVAEGPPEAGMAYFPAGARPAELAALAWYLEAGSRAFYRDLASAAGERETAGLYEQLARAEERHQESLRGLYRRTAGPGAPADFPRAVIPQDPPDAVMEGGIDVAQALGWSRGRQPRDLLEYCVSLETNSYDLYLRMRTATADPEARGVFDHLAAEEQRHLELLTARFERLVDDDAPGAGAGFSP